MFNYVVASIPIFSKLRIINRNSPKICWQCHLNSKTRKNDSDSINAFITLTPFSVEHREEGERIHIIKPLSQNLLSDVDQHAVIISIIQKLGGNGFINRNPSELLLLFYLI